MTNVAENNWQTKEVDKQPDIDVLLIKLCDEIISTSKKMIVLRSVSCSTQKFFLQVFRT